MYPDETSYGPIKEDGERTPVDRLNGLNSLELSDYYDEHFVDNELTDLAFLTEQTRLAVISNAKKMQTVRYEKKNPRWRMMTRDEQQVQASNQRDLMRGKLKVSEWRAIQKVWKRKCAYCRKAVANLELEHKLAISCGGTTELNNIVPACEYCNCSKGVKPLEKWLPSEQLNEFRIRDFMALSALKFMRLC